MTCRRGDRSPRASNCGGDRDRTGGLVLAKHALSQLSYTPAGSVSRTEILLNLDPDRFELSTFRLSSERSNQLSYGSSTVLSAES